MTAADWRAQLRLARFTLETLIGRGLGRVYRHPAYRWRFLGNTPEKLVVAPQDLRTGDPTMTADLAGGYMILAGLRVEIGQLSPFALTTAPQEWRDALYSFDWIRDLKAAGTPEAKAQATALVDDWLTHHGKPGEEGWDPYLVARRLIAWLCHSPFILDNADHSFYRRFLGSITFQARYLRYAAADLPDGGPRLIAATALTYAGLCLSGFSRFLALSTRWLDDELKRQILPDGGLISRNPGAILDMLLDLLPLRQTFTARAISPPESLITGIDRMMPMLRFFRHSDGSVANFNGAEPFFPERLATVFAYDEARGTPVTNAPHSGYQRLADNDLVVIMDTGTAPPIAVSIDGHASCLAFEFSARANRIIVNCGKPLVNVEDWRDAARQTAAHSTACLSDTSSAQFATEEWATRRVGRPIVDGPKTVTVKRQSDEDTLSVQASHDGYMRAFGVEHRRRLTLDAARDVLIGEDQFVPRSGTRSDAPFAIRFHLHPSIRVVELDDRSTALFTSDGEVWRFISNTMPHGVEESIFLADPRGARRTRQLVVSGQLRANPVVPWELKRVTDQSELETLVAAIEGISSTA
ncbi:MAG: heparinase II/III family protein [Pseudomonadota bacterium]